MWLVILPPDCILIPLFNSMWNVNNDRAITFLCPCYSTNFVYVHVYSSMIFQPLQISSGMTYACKMKKKNIHILKVNMMLLKLYETKIFITTFLLDMSKSKFQIYHRFLSPFGFTANSLFVKIKSFCYNTDCEFIEVMQTHQNSSRILFHFPWPWYGISSGCK